MVQRQSIVAFDSTEVQGEGSWVKVRMITHGESKQMKRDWRDVAEAESAKDVPFERRLEFQDASDRIVVDKVIDWNWVDDDGTPLPLPKDDPTIVDRLTELETNFIANAMRGEAARKK